MAGHVEFPKILFRLSETMMRPVTESYVAYVKLCYSNLKIKM